MQQIFHSMAFSIISDLRINFADIEVSGMKGDLI